MGAGPSTVTSKSYNRLPKWVRGPMKEELARYNELLYPGGELAAYPYPDQEIVPFQPYQQQALEAIGSYGTQAPAIDAATQRQISLMNTNAINNPLLSQYFNMAATDVTGQMAGAMLKSGGYGSSGHQEQLGRALNNLATSIYMPAWQEQERLRQQAAAMAPTLTEARYLPAQALMGAGGMQQEQMQQEINTRIENEWRRAGWPYQSAEMMLLPLQVAAGSGGVSKMQTPAGGGSPLQKILDPLGIFGG